MIIITLNEMNASEILKLIYDIRFKENLNQDDKDDLEYAYRTLRNNMYIKDKVIVK